MKYLYNPATDSFESLEPTMRERFALGGGVIQGEKVGDRENFAGPLAIPFIAPGMVPAIAGLLGVTATTQAITTYLQNNPKAIDTVKKALELSGKMTGVLPFGTKPGEQPDVEEEIKEFGKLKGFDKAPEILKEKGTEAPKETKPEIPVSEPPKVEPLPGLTVDEEAKSPQIFPIKVKGGEKKLYGKTVEEYNARAKEYAKKKRERDKAGESEKFRPDPEKEAIIFDAIKKYKVGKEEAEAKALKGDPNQNKPGNYSHELHKLAANKFRELYGRDPALNEMVKYTGRERHNTARIFKKYPEELGSLLPNKDYMLITPKTVDTKLTKEYKERDRNKLLNEAIELDTVRTYKDEVFFKNDERRDFFINNFIKRANFGFNRKGVPGLTYEELAKEFNISKGAVSKIIQVLQKDPLISSQLDRPEFRDSSYHGTVSVQTLAEGRRQLAEWERSNVDIQDNKVSEVNKILSELTLDEVKEQYPQIITDFKWKLVKTGDDKGKIIEVDRPNEKLEKDIKKAFSIEHGKNKSTREVDIQRLTNRYFTTIKNNNLLVSIKAYIKREGESSPEINDWLTERGIRIIVDKKSYGAPPEVMFNSKTGEHVNFNKALEFYGLDGDVTGPTKERYEALKLKDEINEQLGEGTIKTAEEAPEPDKSILRGLFERFTKENMAEGGRVGFQDGTPNPIFTQIIAALDNPDLIKNLEEENKQTLKEQIYGDDGDRTLMQTFNTMFANPKAYPYYAQELASGAANIPELAFRFPFAVTGLVSDVATGRGDKLKRAMETLDPKLTKAIKEKIGFTDMLEKSRTERTGPQRTTGGILELGAEIPGPATPYFLIKAFPKIANQIRNIVGSDAAARKVNEELEKRLAVDTVDQTRRDILLAAGAGGAVAILKFLGLDKLMKAGKVAKAAPEIITKGGTPKYFFDFVNLIKTKGDDITDKAATIERQKVYDYNGYTMYEDISTGKISIRKDTEGGASYYIGDGEYETVDGIIRKEEIIYDPPETIVGKDGKPQKVPDIYEENTLKPDYDGKEGDMEGGLESIDEILELLSKNGKTYSKEELLKMGIDPDLTNVATGAGTIPKDMVGQPNPFKTKKAEGGIIAGVSSGPPPKSGPTPHGLPYVAKNVRPITERK